MKSVSKQDISPFPARVFALIPTNSDKALILRRGPAKIVGVYSWNTTTNAITSYQWLRGRIYEYLSDITPDGRYFIYSANKKGEGYTVISRYPWLKAISFWCNAGGWGGGIFLSNKEYSLYDGSNNNCKFISKELLHRNSTKELHEYGVYHFRLLRFGWKKQKDTGSTITYFKKLSANKNNYIEKTVHRWILNKPKGKGQFGETHKLITKSHIYEKPTWEWCDLINKKIIWSEHGCLYSSKIDSESIIAIPELIYDFNNDSFKNKQAPY